jgi:hypothetical protein
MNWIARVPAEQRRRVASLPARIEVLETRTLLANGINPQPGAPIPGAPGVPLSNVVVATFTITDASGSPGTKWQAKVDWGDGSRLDKNVRATALPNGSFEFLDSHTYAAAGPHTITVDIAVPGSAPGGPSSGTGGKDNEVKTTVTITNQPTPTPTPTPPPSIGPFQSSGLTAKAKVNKTFHASVARFSDPHTKPQQFSAKIDWGDQSGSTPGQIRRQGNGRYLVAGAHRYGTLGTFQVTVTISDAAGDVIAAHSSVIVTGTKR